LIIDHVRRTSARRFFLALAVFLGSSPSSAQSVLLGAGATFPEPLYTKWFAGFAEQHPEYRILYESVGSEEGVRRLRDGAVDFAGSDMPLDENQLANLGHPVLQLPSVIGAAVPIYHLEGVTQDLRLTPDTLAGIFLGRIKRWSDPAIQSVNRGIALPAREIVVVHRSDGSGTTFVWTDYLSKISPQWKSTAGTGTSVEWPVGIGAAGNGGVAQRVRETPYSIGYVEFIYALLNRLSYAAVRNAGGRYITADLDSITAAAANSAQQMPASFRLSITNATGRNSYPIASFTYLLVRVKTGDAAKDRFLRDLLQWILAAGQRQAAGLGYGSLPPEIAARERRAIDSVY